MDLCSLSSRVDRLVVLIRKKLARWTRMRDARGASLSIAGQRLVATESKEQGQVGASRK
jgi:hypothetical protein